MKKLCLLLFSLVLMLSVTGCTNPNAYSMDVYKGNSPEYKVLHLNASDREKREKIEGIRDIILSTTPTERPISLLPFYPSFTVDININGERVSAIVNLKKDVIEVVYLPSLDGKYDTSVIHESTYESVDFRAFIHD